MASCRRPGSLCRALRNAERYLSRYPDHLRSVFFEELAVQAFVQILHLPFYDADTDETNVPKRVTWNGSHTTKSKAPSGPDGVARAHGFFLLLEATRKTGTTQLTQEIGPLRQHASHFLQVENIAANDLYVLMVTPALTDDTYTALRSLKEQYTILGIEAADLARLLDACWLAFTTRHCDVRRLLTEIREAMRREGKIDHFRDETRRLLENWRVDILRAEKCTVLAMRAYEAMVKQEGGVVATSTIWTTLQSNRELDRYLKPIGSSVSRIELGEIAEVLLSQSLAYRLGKDPTSDEDYLCPVPCGDYCFRSHRCQQEVRRINAR